MSITFVFFLWFTGNQCEVMDVTADRTTIEVNSRWGKPAMFPYLRHSEGAHKLAVLFPGQNYTLDAPLMWYAARAVFEAGCDVLGVEYGFQVNRTPIQSEDIPLVVTEISDTIGRMVQDSQYPQVVFIAKSLGTVIASQVLEVLNLSVRNHIFLTPLRRTIPFIQKVENMLVVVGDQDNLFGSSEIEQISKFPSVQLHVVTGANHGLEIDGDCKQSLIILQQVVNKCATFCESLL
jgi:hypothetical protein